MDYKNLYQDSTVDVIVCVYNALEYVKVCLESLVAKKTIPFRLIIVDSGSDKETKQYLSSFAEKYNSLLITNHSKTDYTLASNQGLRLGTGNYSILLNSDTIVTLFWIEKLIACMESDSRVGLVGPLSNSASYQSVPKDVNGNGGSVNELENFSQNLTLEQMSYLIEKQSNKSYPIVNQVNGFCFMINRSVLNKIGYQDEINFPSYGGEDDYCIRANAAGFLFKIAHDCYIYHHKSKSYDTEEKIEKRKDGGNNLREKHGRSFVKKHYLEIKNNQALTEIREKIDKKLSQSKEPRKYHKSVLYYFSEYDQSKTLDLKREKIHMKVALPFHAKPLFIAEYPELKDSLIFFDNENDLIRISQHFDTIIAADQPGNKTLQKISEHYPHITLVNYR